MQHIVQGNHQTHNHWHISLKASWKENFHAKLETDANVNVMTDETLKAIGSRHNKSHFIFGRQNTRHVTSFFANIETRLNDICSSRQGVWRKWHHYKSF